MQTEIALALFAGIACAALSAQDAAPRPEAVLFQTAADDEPFIGIDIGAAEKGGVSVRSVVAGSPAAGILRAGDRIVHLGGHEVGDVDGLIEARNRFEPGDVVEIVVIREGDDLAVELELGSRDSAPGGLFGARLPAAAPEVLEWSFSEEDGSPGEHAEVEERWREVLEHQDHAMRQWSEEFEERMAEVRHRMEDRFGDMAEHLEKFRRQHARDGVPDSVRHSVDDRVEQVLEALRANREARSVGIEELRARMNEMEAERRERVEQMREEGLPSRVWNYTTPGGGHARIEIHGDGDPKEWIQIEPLEWKWETRPEIQTRVSPDFRILTPPARGRDIDTLRKEIAELREEIQELRAKIHGGGR